MDTEPIENKPTSSSKVSFPSLSRQEAPESTRDPLRVLREIAADASIDSDSKAWLFNFQ